MQVLALYLQKLLIKVSFQLCKSHTRLNRCLKKNQLNRKLALEDLANHQIRIHCIQWKAINLVDVMLISKNIRNGVETTLWSLLDIELDIQVFGLYLIHFSRYIMRQSIFGHIYHSKYVFSSFCFTLSIMFQECTILDLKA